MGFKRRSLLKATALTLAAWALEGPSPRLLNASAAVLAAPARRKFALLVGLDQYDNSASCPDLLGCRNDLVLQRNLLIYRFGFEPGQILTLTNKQASRSGFQAAFLEHLLGQVTAEDTVFFHFSGYGSTVQTAEADDGQRAFVLYESCVASQPATLKDLPEATLILMLRSLPTQQIVSVLDTGYRLPEDSPMAIAQGGRLRTRPSPAPAPFDAQTLDAQRFLRQQMLRAAMPVNSSDGSSEDFSSAFQTPGLILRATDLMPAVLELDGEAGGVGLFTYALSQQLWSTADAATWREVQAGTRTRMALELNGAQMDGLPPSDLAPSDLAPSDLAPPPSLDERAPAQPPSKLAKRSLNRSLQQSGLPSRSPAGGVGVVLAVRSSGDITLWLGGLSSQAIASADDGSIFRVVAQQGSAQQAISASQVSDGLDLQIQTRSGLQAQAKIVGARSGQSRSGQSSSSQSNSGQSNSGQSSLAQPSPALRLPQVGALLQEQVRAIPRDIDLAIAIDKRLDRIERVDATSALTAIARVVVVTGREPADYVFGRVAPRAETLVAALPNDLSRDQPSDQSSDRPSDQSSDRPSDLEKLELPGSEYGLLTLGREVLPSALGASSEAIKTAVQRLQPYLDTLRTAKQLRLLENSLTTQLRAQSRWERLSGASDSFQDRHWLRPASEDRPLALTGPRMLSLKAGDRLQYQLKNESDRPLYALILGFDPRGRWKPWLTTHLTLPLVPEGKAQGEIPLGKRPGLTDFYTLFSLAPFEQMNSLLTGDDETVMVAQGGQTIADPRALSQALLQDLSRASQQIQPEMDPEKPLSDAVYRLNLLAWATFRQTCRIVA